MTYIFGQHIESLVIVARWFQLPLYRPSLLLGTLNEILQRIMYRLWHHLLHNGPGRLSIRFSIDFPF